MAEETNTQQVEIRDYAIDEYVPMEARYYGAKEMTSTWICANANPTTWYMGTILGSSWVWEVRFSRRSSETRSYTLFSALVGIIGYKVASTNMGLCRVSFGIAGSQAPLVHQRAAVRRLVRCQHLHCRHAACDSSLQHLRRRSSLADYAYYLGLYYSAYYDVRFRIRSQIHRKSADCCSGVSCNSQRVDRYPDILSRVVLGYLEMVRLR